MNDIGIVKYWINSESNSLDSEWIYAVGDTVYLGTGITESEKISSYEGDYKVTYFDEDKKPYLHFDMKVVKQDSHYVVEWSNNGKLQFLGVGQVHDNSLYVGWRKVV